MSAPITHTLVGREAELALMDSALQRAGGGAFAAVALAGEPGIGKSAVLRELCRRARARGWLVFAGRGIELERDLPFGVFVAALDEHLRAAAQVPARLGEEVGAELATVFPSLAALLTSGAPPLADERYRAHRAVRVLLAGLAEARPMLLALDDLQWADRSSIELLDALLRRPPEGGVLIAVALRPHPADERLDAALASGERDGALARIVLGPLERDAARGLLNPDMDPHGVAALLHDSGGNPFYLEQLARAARLRPGTRTDDPDLAAIDAIGVPPPVAMAIADELRSLAPAARQLLWGAAVAGDPFALELAAVAGECGDGETLGLIDELLRCELVRPTGTPRRFAFRHPLVRRAVYDTSTVGWRLAAHERCARALRASGASASALAHHVEHYARGGDEDAIALLTQAADAAAARAPASAARWYAAALALIYDGPASIQRRASLLGSLAMVLAGTGRISDSRDALLELLALLPADAGEEGVRLVAACAGIEHVLGEHERAHARVSSALAAVADPRSWEAVALMVALADGAMYPYDHAGMCSWGERAACAADALGDRALGAAGAAIAAFGQMLGGDIDVRRTAAAAARMDALTDAELARELLLASHLGFAELRSGDRVAQAADHCARAIAVARSSRQGGRLVLLYMLQGHALAMLGRLSDAMLASEATLDAARAGGTPSGTVWALLTSSWVHTHRGAIDDAIRAGEEALALAGAYAGKGTMIGVASYLAYALLEGGEAARARELLRSVRGPTSLAGRNHEALVRCELALGDVEAARAWAAESDKLAARAKTRHTSMLADRAHAALLLATGEPGQAAERALAAAAAATQIGARIDAARARTLAGRALVAAGERAAAGDELHEAAAQLDLCGAHSYRDEAERLLRRLGRRFRRAIDTPTAAVATLTRRELEVAELVAQGMTSREIAQALFLGEKTVETHLRHIFGKLGVTSRASVTRAITTARSGVT